MIQIYGGMTGATLGPSLKVNQDVYLSLNILRGYLEVLAPNSKPALNPLLLCPRAPLHPGGSGLLWGLQLRMVVRSQKSLCDHWQQEPYAELCSAFWV